MTTKLFFERFQWCFVADSVFNLQFYWRVTANGLMMPRIQRQVGIPLFSYGCLKHRRRLGGAARERVPIIETGQCSQ